MKNKIVVGLVTAFLGVMAGCSGGVVSGGDAGSSGSSGSSGGSSGSSGGSSGTSGSSGGGTACTEFKVGGAIGPGIGGSAQAQVAVQAIADLGGATATQLAQLTASCKSIAVALGASTGDQSAADSAADARSKVKAWCALSIQTLGTAKATAGGALTVDAPAAKCKLAVATKATCQGRCSSSGPCDSKANPYKCTGGILSTDYCEGGKLEGGCNVDAKCDANCDVTLAAAAMCVASPVTVTVTGAADPTTAAKVKSTIEANLPTILGLEAHFETEAAIASAVTNDADVLVDIKASCIPPVIAAAQNAAQDINAGATASTEVRAAAN